MTDYKVDFTVTTIADKDIAIQTVSGMVIAMYKYKFIWDLGSKGSYNKSKNNKWTNFLLEDTSPYIIHIDRDMVFTQQDLDYIVEDLRAGYDLVGAAYNVHSGKHLTAWGIDGEGIEFNGKMQEVLYMSQGFCGISRRVLQKIVDELKLPILDAKNDLIQYPFCMDAMDEQPVIGKMWLSEDYYFCNLCKKVGVVPVVDTRVNVGHAGEMVWYPQHAAKFQGTTRINESYGAIPHKEK